MAAPEEAQRTTLYPKISGKIQDYAKELSIEQESDPELRDVTSIVLVGTVKLHGVHADVVIDNDNNIRLQSRNMLSLTRKNDVQDFAVRVLPLAPHLIALKSRILARFLDLNPGATIQPEHPLIIAGEWIGPGVQKKVALEHLPTKMFVIISLKINDNWISDEVFGDVHDEDHHIYHISRSGFYHREIPLQNPIESLESLQALPDVVEAECPFAKSFGITGLGEGIVRKPASPRSLSSDPKFWLKMRGTMSRIRPVAVKDVGKTKEAQKEYAKEFAESVVGELRLEQGWQWLEEMRITQDLHGVESFLKWLVGDVAVEEKSLIAERKLDWNMLRKEIELIGKDWYFRQMKMGR